MSTEQPSHRNVPTADRLLWTGNAVKALAHVPRLLALDGGGVRGLSSLLILEKLMKEVQRLREEENDPTPDGKLPLPCQYFVLICGTSTGGLIAIMLGRLRMVFLDHQYIH